MSTTIPPLEGVPPAAQTPESQFQTFLKRSVGLVGAVVAAVPVFTDYLNVVPPPGLGRSTQPNKLLPVVAMVLSATIFLFLFWIRDRLAQIKSGIVGLLSILVGAIVIVATPFVNHPLLAVGTYLFGFLLSLGGASLLFIFGFQRSQARLGELQELAPRLDPEQWNALTRFATTLLSIRENIARKEIPKQSKEALRKSADNLLSEYYQMLAKLKEGTLEIRGPAMDEIYSFFLEGVQKAFRALSRDDLSYWSSSAATRYLESNRRLIERGCQIERVFLLKQSRPPNRQEVDAIRNQILMGVTVRIAYLENCHLNVIDDDRELDFGLFDDFAVSFWRITASRIFRVSTSVSDCRRYRKLYDNTLAICVGVPGKTGAERTVFKTPEDLEAWYQNESGVGALAG